MSYRLYIGNLDRNATEEDLRSLFSEKNLPVENVLLKTGYAFVECDEQATVDSAIDQLSGLQLLDKAIAVEPAVSKSSAPAKTKLSIRNVPSEISDESMKETLSHYGSIKDFSRRNDSVHVTYSSAEEAQEAREKLQDSKLQGQMLKVDFLSKKPPGHRNLANQPSRNEFPLRVLVSHQHVGAIIGRSGQTIRNITQQTNARVDVVRRDNFMQEDKMVLIMGAETQNCVDACREILKVIFTDPTEPEATSLEVELRILAHNNLCGRLIGKQGVIIKGIMEETHTVLTVSSANSVGPMNADRVVTIKGSLEAVCTATSKVYDKLKACNDSDLQNPGKFSQTMGQGGMPPMPFPSWQLQPSYMPGFAGAGPRGAQSIPYPPPNNAGLSTAGGHMTCYLYIPKASVGAVIGSKGSFINHVKQESRASCQVQESPADDPDSTERPVKITGYPDCVWKAQWFVFEKVKNEGFAGNEFQRLRCDMIVPKVMVGRIIGKGGRNVRHVQDISDASIKLSESQDPEGEEVPVEIIGNIYSQTLAQALIRQLIVQGQLMGPMPEPMRGRMPHAPHRYQPMHHGPARHGPQQRGDNRGAHSAAE